MPCSTQSPSLPLWFAYLISRNKMFALAECLVYFGNSVRLSTSTRWLLWWLISCVSLNGAKGCPEIVKCDFWVCFWGCFWKRLTLELVNRVRKIAITSDGGQHQAINGLHRTKTEEGWLCSLGLSWNVNLFLPSDIRRLWFLGLELHQWLSWASSVQVADCDLHNHVSHSLRINLSGYLLIYIFSWFCFSEEPWLIHLLCERVLA